MPKIIWTCCFSTFAIFNAQPLWILIQGWKQGQESHYIQPSNLSSALSLPMHCIEGGFLVFRPVDLCITVALVIPPEGKLTNATSVHWTDFFFFTKNDVFVIFVEQ